MSEMMGSKDLRNKGRKRGEYKVFRPGEMGPLVKGIPLQQDDLRFGSQNPCETPVTVAHSSTSSAWETDTGGSPEIRWSAILANW